MSGKPKTPPGAGPVGSGGGKPAGAGKDSARRALEVKHRQKADELLREAQKSVRSAIRNYHKDWSLVFIKFTQAQVKLKGARQNYLHAGLLADSLLSLSAGGRRIHAREVMGVMDHEELTYLLEPRLADEVVLDYLDRKGMLLELELRIEAELHKARLRSEGDELATLARRSIDQGLIDQESGLLASADKMLGGAKKAIVQSQEKFRQIAYENVDIARKWKDGCNAPEEYPTLTLQSQMTLQTNLRERDKLKLHWSERSWQPVFAFDNPTKYCLNSIEVGASYAAICAKTSSWEHAPGGLAVDGSDCTAIVTALEHKMNDALERQKEDMAFKALAICNTDELREAHKMLMAAGKEDRAKAEAIADEFVAAPILDDALVPPQWHDLPPEKLGHVAVTDEVKELHACAERGDVDRVRWLLDECTEQHYMAVNRQRQPFKVAMPGRVLADALDHDLKSALFAAARWNRHEVGQILIEHKASVDGRDLNGATPLHLAAASGAAEMVKVLLEFEADPTARNHQGETPMHWSGRYALGDIDVMRSLAGTAVDLNIADDKKRTLLHHICSNRRFGAKELFMLNCYLLLGADADARDDEENTPLDICDHMEARTLLRNAYKAQGALRVERWGFQAAPPPPNGVPLSINEQALEITMGIPLMCVMHKGRKAYINRRPCLACSVGVVVTTPFKDLTDFAHICAHCGVKEVSKNFIREGRFV